MTKIAINQCGKGAFLSEAGLLEFTRRKGLAAPPPLETINRSDAELIAMMQEKPAVYGGTCAHISIVEIPDDVAWKIARQGNYEWVTVDG